MFHQPVHLDPLNGQSRELSRRAAERYHVVQAAGLARRAHGSPGSGRGLRGKAMPVRLGRLRRFARGSAVLALVVVLGAGTALPEWGSSATAAPPAPSLPASPARPSTASPTTSYLSEPPGPATTVRTTPTRAPSTDRRDPAPPPTRGAITGRALSPAGRPLAGVLVSSVRFKDLANGGYDENELPLLSRTDTDGRFTLPQLTERYLVKLCHPDPGGEACDGNPATMDFTPTYVGPDGVSDSWVRQTRLFEPKRSGRTVGSVKVKSTAVLTGTYREGSGRSLRLLRGDSSVAASTAADEKGRFRFVVAPGTYWLETTRDEGLRTVSTVPGSRTRVRLTPQRDTDVTVSNRSASSLHGRATMNGEPLAGEILVVVDRRGRFAGAVVTDDDGRYSFNSLRPGRYTISNRGAFGEYVVQRHAVRLSADRAVRADFALDQGGSIELTPVDIEGAVVGVDLRNAQGRVVKSYPSREEEPADGLVRFTGLAPGRYELVAVRTSDGIDNGNDTQFPWAARTVTITPRGKVDLGRVPLDRPTLNLHGSAPRGGSRVEFTTPFEDEYLRKDFILGSWASPVTTGWTTNIGADQGRFVVRGFVPGRYLATTTTSLIEPDDGQSTTGGNVATTRRWVTLTAKTTRKDLPAPRGGVVRGEFHYAGTKRPVIAAVGARVTDRGDESYLFPTVSGGQTFGSGYRVERVHAGRARVGVLDVQALGEQIENQGLHTPQSLLHSAPTSEAGTPYYLQASARTVRVRAGQTTRVAPISVHVRGR